MPTVVSEFDVIARQQQQAVPLAPPDLNVNFGAETKLGRFMPDQYPWLTGGIAATDRFNKANAVIGGADPINEVMYKSHRYGKLSFGNKPWGYDIPVAEPGVYNCTVHFAETADAGFRIGARVFDLSISPDGSKPYTATNIDVYAKTNRAMFTVYTETAALITIKQMLKVRVTKKPASKLGAYMAGLTCAKHGPLPKGVTAPPPPKNTFLPSQVKYAPIGETFPNGPVIKGTALNLNCGGGKVGRFLADQNAYLHYGPTTIFSKPNHPIGGADEINLPALTDSRYGLSGESWGYQIPMDSPGMWECTLHFAELIETIKAGGRVFHAQVQDQRMDNIDITAGLNGAQFTSYVKTFENVIVADVLVVRLFRVKGDPTINAITCVRKKPMTVQDAQALLTTRAMQNGVKPPPKAPPAPPKPAEKPVTKPAAPSKPVDNTTSVSPGNATSAPAVPAAPPSVESERNATVPVTNTSRPTPPTPSPTPSASPAPSTEPLPLLPPTVQNTAEPVVETPSPADLEILQDITVDPSPPIVEGKTNVDFRLQLTVTNGTNVNNTLKEQVKEVLANGSKLESSAFSMTQISMSVATKATVQQDTNLDLTAVGSFDNGTAKATTEDLQLYLADGKGTEQLRSLGCEGCTLVLASGPTLPSGSATAPAATSSGVGASTIVAAVVGSVLGALLIVALIAFFVIQRHRQNEVNPAAFDAPPPPEMEDSDGEAPPSSSAHSESERSDYLDDDSTFTAATSRQGDPEAGVTLDKDVWGRGSS